MSLYYLETDKMEKSSRGDGEGHYWGRIEAERPEIAELKFKKLIAGILPSKMMPRSIKSEAAKRMAIKDFKVKEYKGLDSHSRFLEKVNI